jgi:dihydroflavonol-4-reductase
MYSRVLEVAMPEAARFVGVTGASGFVASQIVALLLERGHRVRGTVRRLDRKPLIDPLRRLPGSERLELVEADLLDAASLERAAAGLDALVHAASPYTMEYQDAQKELVDPALHGTRSTLRACALAGSVRRVVLTSSVAAVCDEPPPRPLTEADWNQQSSLERNAYSYSKVVAERAAWSFVESERPGFDLVAINPVAVVGPSLVPPLNTSNGILSSLLGGGYPALVDLAWTFVDVRDVARAHVAALERPAAHGRYLCANLTLSMRELVERVRRVLPGERVPRLNLEGPLGRWFTSAFSLTLAKGARDFVRSSLGRRQLIDSSKLVRELGIAFTDFDVTLRDTVPDLRRWGHLRPR